MAVTSGDAAGDAAGVVSAVVAASRMTADSRAFRMVTTTTLRLLDIIPTQLWGDRAPGGTTHTDDIIDCFSCGELKLMIAEEKSMFDVMREWKGRRNGKMMILMQCHGP